nr:immunoglobulin light chain junction region [Macaca mulatta]MOW39135.1 immunoglobulin light chain junction region [Macaca mulatta]MOW39224.1 immunoglobulin light chain junction region [Macaca mulatta]MOW39226.1 immunoglobulin light chain junction region [Macaca mulatta]MOW39246.1 immunoglobulin light chain junction region [Macaca mulatta]
CQKYDTSPLTF